MEREGHAMKMQKEHVEELRAAIAPVDTEERRATYRAGDFPRAGAVQDLDKRYRWDLLWIVGANYHHTTEGLSMAHIDTALRSIVPPL